MSYAAERKWRTEPWGHFISRISHCAFDMLFLPFGPAARKRLLSHALMSYLTHALVSLARACYSGDGREVQVYYAGENKSSEVPAAHPGVSLQSLL